MTSNELKCEKGQPVPEDHPNYDYRRSQGALTCGREKTSQTNIQILYDKYGAEDIQYWYFRIGENIRPSNKLCFKDTEYPDDQDLDNPYRPGKWSIAYHNMLQIEEFCLDQQISLKRKINHIKLSEWCEENIL